MNVNITSSFSITVETDTNSSHLFELYKYSFVYVCVEKSMIRLIIWTLNSGLVMEVDFI